MKRKKTKKIYYKNVAVGGNSNITVQSMTNTPTSNYKKTYNQIKKLIDAGCEIIRLGVKNQDDILSLKKMCVKSEVPLIADIHFDYKLALESVNAGVAGLRINPGNITEKWKIKEIVQACKANGIPIRIGINSGSLEKKLLEKVEFKKISLVKAMILSAEKEIAYLNKLNFDDIAISLKSSDTLTTIDCYRKFSAKYNYPLHLGITETGTLRVGLVKSALGIGTLLMEGIGDTIRISLSADPVEEVYAGFNILRTLHLRKDLPDLISCPTCTRCDINLFKIANEVEKIIYKVKKPIKIAVMGCVVNGPGEAREADLGITGGKGKAILFKKGKVIKTVDENKILPELLKEINKL